MHYNRSIFTIEEDEIILREVKKMPSNLSKCFIAAGSIIGKTPLQVQSRWYYAIRNNTPVFNIQSNITGVTNKKNYPIGDKDFELKTLSLPDFKKARQDVFSKVRKFFLNQHG